MSTLAGIVSRVLWKPAAGKKTKKVNKTQQNPPDSKNWTFYQNS